MNFKLNSKATLKQGITYCGTKDLSYEDVRRTTEWLDSTLIKVIQDCTPFIVTRVYGPDWQGVRFNWSKADEPNVTHGSLVNCEFMSLLYQVLEDFSAGQILSVRPDSIDAMSFEKGPKFRAFVGVHPFMILEVSNGRYRFIKIENHLKDQMWFPIQNSDMRFFKMNSIFKSVSPSSNKFVNLYDPNKSVDTAETPATIEKVTLTVTFSNEEERRRVIEQIKGIKL